MKIGYACIPMAISEKITRSFILKNFTQEKFYETLQLNLKDLKTILQYNVNNEIKMFRISSDIVPFGSHIRNNIKWWETFKDILQDIGEFIKNNNLRVSMHPGQYTVLNSTSEDVVLKSIKDIEYHTAFLDSLEVCYENKIVIHIGGVYGDKASALERFKHNFNKLSDSAKKRLVLENDEKCFNIEEVLYLCKNLNIPAVFDNLHHKCNPSMGNDLNYILSEVEKTWNLQDGAMKLHYSDEDEHKRSGSHSKFVITENFLNYYSSVKGFSPDIMLEVKDKDLSAIKCINCLEKNIKKSIIYDEWAKYKYSVMEKNYYYYKQCSSIVNESKNIIEFYKYVDFALMSPFNNENFKNAIFHTWGYLKEKVNDREKNEFNNLLKNSEDIIKVKNFIKRLVKKYKIKYLLNSYYFLY